MNHFDQQFSHIIDSLATISSPAALDQFKSLDKDMAFGVITDED